MPDGGAAVDDDQLVAWSTLFWIVVPVALSTMTQPGGSVLGAPPEFSFMLRASPVVCAIDALMYVSGFCYYSCRIGVREAHHVLSDLRFAAGQNEREHEDPVALRRTSPTRLIGFAVLLVQTSRLFAFDGCFETKCAVSAYLASFVLVELLTIKVDLSPRDPNMGPGDTTFELTPGDMTFALTINLSVGFVSNAFDAALGAGFTSIVTCIAAPFLHIIWILHGAIRDKNWAHLTGKLGKILVHAILLSHAILGAYVRRQPSPQPTLRDTVTEVALLPASIFGQFYWLWYIFKMIRRHRRQESIEGASRAERRLQQIVMWFFAILHFVAAVVYYKLSYVSEGTYAPAWTSFFG